MVQNVMDLSLSPEKVMSRLIMLLANMLKITPVRMMVFVDKLLSSR